MQIKTTESTDPQDRLEAQIGNPHYSVKVLSVLGLNLSFLRVKARSPMVDQSIRRRRENLPKETVYPCSQDVPFVTGLFLINETQAYRIPTRNVDINCARYIPDNWLISRGEHSNFEGNRFGTQPS